MWRFLKILWPSQNIWTLQWTTCFVFKDLYENINCLRIITILATMKSNNSHFLSFLRLWEMCWKNQNKKNGQSFFITNKLDTKFFWFLEKKLSSFEEKVRYYCDPLLCIFLWNKLWTNLLTPWKIYLLIIKCEMLSNCSLLWLKPLPILKQFCYYFGPLKHVSLSFHSNVWFIKNLTIAVHSYVLRRSGFLWIRR